jgi:hypothetical protein
LERRALLIWAAVLGLNSAILYLWPPLHLDTFIQISLFFAGIFMLFLAWKALRRGWQWAASWFGILGVVSLLAAQPWMQGFLKTNIIGQIQAYGAKISEFQQVVQDMNQKLLEQQNLISAQQTKLASYQTQLTHLQDNVGRKQAELESKASSAAVSIAKSEAAMADTTKQIAQQQKVRLPRFDGHELSPKKGLNHDQEEGRRGHAPAV